MADEEGLLRLPIGERIRYVRREILGVTQEAFARQLGVSGRTVKRWEASFIAPTKENAEKIAALASLASEIFYPDETKEPEPIIELRQMITGMEEMLVTVTREMLQTLAEISAQLARQTDLLAKLEEKVDDSAPAASARRTRKR